MNGSRWLDTRATAEYISVNPSALPRLVREGRIPKPSYQLGPRSPRWDVETLDAAFDGGSASTNADMAVAAAVKKMLAEPPRRRRRQAG